MANVQAMTTSFKQEVLIGNHQFGACTLVSRGSLTAPTKDTFKALLVKQSGSVGAGQTNVGTPGTGAPSTSNIGTDEVAGAGYSAGGVAVTNAVDPATTGTTAYWTPSASFTYTAVTLPTAFDCVVVYNSTQNNKTVSVHTFGAQTVSGTFTLTMPTNDASNALIRFA